MAQVKLLKIGTDGLPEEMTTSADDVTLASFTVTGGGPVLNANLDMNNGNISDANDLSFTDPTTDGITNTSGTHPADKIMFEDEENSMDVGSAILFPVIADNADQVDAMRVPALAGVPSASPTDGGSGYLVFDDTNNALYIWDGAAWDNLNVVDSAEKICNSYTSGEILALGEVVYISAADTASLADATTNYQAIGLAKTGVAAAAAVDIQSEGVFVGLSGLTAGGRYFLDTTAGALVASAPTGAGARVVQIGYAKSATDLHLQIAFVGRRA